MVSPAVTGQFGGDPEGASLLLTRLAPPAQQTRLLRRQRVEAHLAVALEYPLCFVVGPAGSGKTTALAALATYGGWPTAWCRARPSDDPAQLLRHLTAAFRPVAALDEARIAAALLAHPGEPGPALDLLVNELAAALDDDTLLVIDDYHLIDQRPNLRAVIERMVAILPLRLHLALACRSDPTLATVETTRLRGELHLVTQVDLAFSLDEARALYALANRPPPESLDELVTLSRGWPLALQIALGADDWRTALGLRGAAPIDGYLSQELMADLPAPLQQFLLITAGLRYLDPGVCALLTEQSDPQPWLSELEQRHLFVERTATGLLQIQPILRTFLINQAIRHVPAWPELQQRAAAYFRARDDADGVLHHLLLCHDQAAAAETLVTYAPTMIAAGQPEQVLAWAKRLDEQTRTYPPLIEAQAMALRQIGHYDEALHAYMTAASAYAEVGDLDGQIRALRGQAELYLDTVQPAHATDLLKRALRLLPTSRASERAELLRMQAENWANRGRADVALILEQAARQIEEHAPDQPGLPATLANPATSNPAEPNQLPVELPPRLLLRSGRLNEARQQLEAQLWAESTGQSGARRPWAHREPVLLLALIYAMLGSGTRALAMARRGLVEAQQSGARLTEAIAELRLGHAYQLVAANDLAPSLQRYAEALRLIQTVGVTRTRAEGYLGLTLLYGHSGDLPRAEADAREGMQIAAAAGDEWTAALILLALGGAAVAYGEPRAVEWIEQARQQFARGGDAYGMAVTTLWRAIAALRAGDPQADHELISLLDAVVTHNYLGILISPSLFGPRDLASLVPLLLRARRLGDHGELARVLLRQGFPTIAADDTVEDYHPGYTLRVQMLGTFRVWRGSQEIQAREWQREKARQLFQLLLTHRGHWIQREQICAWLWPEADLEAAERQFKVTLNALNSALEPARPPRVAPFFVRRQGLAYSFSPSYGVWIDVDEFELRAAASASSDDADFARRNAQLAVQLYRGDYLAESLYDPWTTEERERLTARFLATAVGYANRLSNEGDQAQAIQLCEQVLRRDRCYEEAYQALMRAHARAGSRSQALRSYARCTQALRDELAMEPLPETDALYEALKRNESI
ncbi:MAG: BTAD domain-containing putative transcriptional regulator [Oscillochloridaceae bacterium umkhey_bin13]